VYVLHNGTQPHLPSEVKLASQLALKVPTLAYSTLSNDYFCCFALCYCYDFASHESYMNDLVDEIWSEVIRRSEV
jgi:hypothetical protein